MKKIILFLIILLSFVDLYASHIAGGELFYEYLGAGNTPNTSRYKVTMRLFRDCNSTGQVLDAESVKIGIFNKSTNVLYTSKQLSRDSITRIELDTRTIPCVVNAPQVCFQIGYFSGTVELPDLPGGYTLTWVRCCRSENIANLSTKTGVGATYVTGIPGTADLVTGHSSSPQFAVKDAALVCQNKNFKLDFGATDKDGDELTYSFCDAYSGGTSSAPNPEPTTTLSLPPLTYEAPFSGTSPLGSTVSINSATGEITGVAPPRGRYVINVCVTEKRNGKVINEHRKDFILQVGDCDYAAANPIPAAGAYCNDFKVPFSNDNSSPTITAYQWDFGVPGIDTDTSTQANPYYTYAKEGVYKITLTVRGAAGCEDTKTTTLGVYPGFQADFNTAGSCFKNPYNFVDKTIAAFGSVTGWKWDFGDASSTTDVSTIQNPNYKYADSGTRNVTLIATSSNGCIDTITKPVNIQGNPFLRLPFHDTLICTIDTLQLAAEGTGSFTWTPAYNIINPNSANPLVYPKDTTTYVVTLDQNGCSTKDSVKINTLDFITVFAGRDTTICTTDTIRLNAVSQGLSFRWTPAETIIGNANTKNPIAKPLQNTTYYVTANLGKCQSSDNISVRSIPYPTVNAGPDVLICYGQTTTLGATIKGSSFTWTPASSLSNAKSLTPVARPINTTNYILTTLDTLGCPKPISDTVLVQVVPPVKAFAGNDTSIVANQPLQLNATGGDNYFWTPAIGMNNPTIANPLVTLGPSYDSITYRVRVSLASGCSANDDIKVKVFKTPPDIFIPTAFTPNSDGKNEILKPIPVGIRDFKFFRIYNRWGQQVFSTSTVGAGWDGNHNGVPQGTGTYVFMAEAVDYLGKNIFKKGTVILIR